MLWKKESFCQDALLIDIIDKFDSGRDSNPFDDLMSRKSAPEIEKNNRLSDHFRKMAMEHSNASNWHDVIELLN